MICDHPDCSTRTTDRCGACDLPFCAQHLYKDGPGRYCGACRNARWRKGIEREAVGILGVLVIGPFMALRYVDNVTKFDLELAVAGTVVMAAVYGVVLVLKLREGPPVKDAVLKPRR